MGRDLLGSMYLPRKDKRHGSQDLGGSTGPLNGQRVHLQILHDSMG